MSDKVVVTWDSLERMSERALIKAYSRYNLPEAQESLFKRIRALEVENSQMWRDHTKNWNRFRHRVWSLKPTISSSEFEFSRLGGLYEAYQIGELGYVQAVLEDCQKYKDQSGPCIEQLNSLIKLADVSLNIEYIF